MTSGYGPDYGREVGNPTVNADSMSFPFDPIASRFLELVPDGLVASPQVLSQFLDPPEERGDWFSNEVWQQASQLLRDDPAITSDEYQDMIARFNTVQDGFIAWSSARPAMPNGYAETLPRDMRAAGAATWIEIGRMARGPLTTLEAKPGVADNTKQGLENFGQVLFEYIACMAYELEASHDQIDVEGVRDRQQREATHPWEPATTPDTVGRGITIGAQRLPQAPEAPGTGEPGTGEPAPSEPDTGEPGTGEPGGEPGTGEGGGGGEK